MSWNKIVKKYFKSFTFSFNFSFNFPGGLAHGGARAQAGARMPARRCSSEGELHRGGSTPPSGSHAITENKNTRHQNWLLFCPKAWFVLTYELNIMIINRTGKVFNIFLSLLTWTVLFQLYYLNLFLLLSVRRKPIVCFYFISSILLLILFFVLFFNHVIENN